MKFAIAVFVVFVLSFKPCNAQALVRYEGCMLQQGATPVDDGVGDTASKRGPFRHLVTGEKRINVQKCVTACWKRRFKYAAMQGGVRCYCASTTKGLDQRSDRLCYERCEGNCRQRCGGPVILSVYDTAYAKEPDLSFPGGTLRTGLTGCYKKSSMRAICPRSHQQEVPSLKSERMTAQMCSLYCGADVGTTKSQVAVLMDIDGCCCGPSHQRVLQQPRVSNDQCQVPCVGSGKTDIDVGCGGAETMVVYSISHLKNAGMPQERVTTFTRKNEWLSPPFPDNDKFELKDGVEGPPESMVIKPPSQRTIENAMYGTPTADDKNTGRSELENSRQMPELLDTAPREGSVQTVERVPVRPVRPMVEPENTGVNVVDVPEEESSGWSTGMLVLIFLVCLIILGGVAYVLNRRRQTVAENVTTDGQALLEQGKMGEGKNGDKNGKNGDQKNGKKNGKNGKNGEEKDKKKKKKKKKKKDKNSLADESMASTEDEMLPGGK